MRFCSFDPGQAGAIAIIDGENVDAYPFPFNGDELDILVLSTYFLGEDCFAALERVHAMPKQGVCSVWTFAQGYGELRGMLKTLSVPFIEPTPQAWKKLILAGMDWKGRKECSIEYVTKRYPQVNLKPGKKRVPHDGMADAICLAEYAKRIYLTKNS